MSKSKPSCRLCLLYGDLTRLFTRRMTSRDVLGKILKYFQLEITDSDCHSTFICSKCLSKVEDFHLFYTTVQSNQELLANLKDENESNSFKSDDESLETEIKESELERILLSKENEVSAEFTDSIEESKDEIECKMEIEEEMTNPVEVKVVPTIKWKDIEFPVMIKENELIVKGQELLDVLNKFFILSCDICPAHRPKFKCLTKLLIHYNKAHLRKGYVICCAEKMSTRARMAFHMAYHLQPESFTCSICEKVLKSPKSLQSHLQNHLPESERPFACPSCPRRYSYPNALTEHLIKHQPDSERVNHICSKCGKSFLSLKRLSTHTRQSHVLPEINPYACTICDKRFGQRCNLINHQMTHEPHAHQVQCEQCGKWLKNIKVLQRHMPRVHSSLRFECELCKYWATTRQCLLDHMRHKHSNIKPHGCEYCDKSFKTKKHLRNHIGIHTGEKRYACEFCDLRFVSNSNYYGHRKRVHPIELAEYQARKAAEEELLRGKFVAERT